MSYRINFTVEERRDGIDADYSEIGFGGTGGWDRLEDAIHEANSALQNDVWAHTKKDQTP